MTCRSKTDEKEISIGTVIMDSQNPFKYYVITKITELRITAANLYTKDFKDFLDGKSCCLPLTKKIPGASITFSKFNINQASESHSEGAPKGNRASESQRTSESKECKSNSRKFDIFEMILPEKLTNSMTDWIKNWIDYKVHPFIFRTLIKNI